MGLFKTIKLIKEEYKKIKNNMEMSMEDMENLSDEALYDVLWTRIFAIDRHLEVTETLNTLKGAQKVFYIVDYYEKEVNNGGLCQYFVNSSRYTAPYLSECLEIIGADAHKAHYDNFISSNNIDVNNLDSFIIEEAEEFEEQNNRYPFDDYDDKFYDMEPVFDFTIKYARKHLEDFI